MFRCIFSTNCSSVEPFTQSSLTLDESSARSNALKQVHGKSMSRDNPCRSCRIPTFTIRRTMAIRISVVADVSLAAEEQLEDFCAFLGDDGAATVWLSGPRVQTQEETGRRRDGSALDTRHENKMSEYKASGETTFLAQRRPQTNEESIRPELTACCSGFPEIQRVKLLKDSRAQFRLEDGLLSPATGAPTCPTWLTLQQHLAIALTLCERGEAIKTALTSLKAASVAVEIHQGRRQLREARIGTRIGRPLSATVPQDSLQRVSHSHAYTSYCFAPLRAVMAKLVFYEAIEEYGIKGKKQFEDTGAKKKRQSNPTYAKEYNHKYGTINKTRMYYGCGWLEREEDECAPVENR
ncbi:hypothetical protein F2P81_009891 [Scophthalmus maximus]|uniref:Uncharacterized protein n=1 Tax=Scophthalmus maximus TaxID=52904 RepID=A0A6A4SU83_SCOMX|nr:hypothetical protein F2P81_009891 [Scophthalmus maximus]